MTRNEGHGERRLLVETKLALGVLMGVFDQRKELMVVWTGNKMASPKRVVQFV